MKTIREIKALDNRPTFGIYIFIEVEDFLNVNDIYNFKVGIGKQVLERQSVITQGTSRPLLIYKSWDLNTKSRKVALKSEVYWHNRLKRLTATTNINSTLIDLCTKNPNSKKEWFFTKHMNFIISLFQYWAKDNNYKEINRQFVSIEEARLFLEQQSSLK